jgi:hypothetical protein
MGKYFDEVRAEFDERYRRDWEAKGYIRVPISLHNIMRSDWIHANELKRLREDFKEFFDIQQSEQRDDSHV